MELKISPLISNKSFEQKSKNVINDHSSKINKKFYQNLIVSLAFL